MHGLGAPATHLGVWCCSALDIQSTGGGAYAYLILWHNHRGLLNGSSRQTKNK